MEIKGTGSVRALDDESCELTVEGTFDIRVPIVGKAIGKKVVKTCRIWGEIARR